MTLEELLGMLDTGPDVSTYVWSEDHGEYIDDILTSEFNNCKVTGIEVSVFEGRANVEISICQ